MDMVSSFHIEPSRYLKEFAKMFKFPLHDSVCWLQGSEWEKDWAESGRGDEVCDILNTELELSDTLDVFPEGLSLGFYYNYCQEEEWKDTGARTEVRVCCQGGKYKDCQEILEELEYEDEAVTADLMQSGT